MDQHELAQELYDDYRSDFGDGDYAWNESWDEAGEIIRRKNARQDALEDYRASGEVVTTISDNKRANNPPEVSGVSGGIAISILGALGSPAAIVILGLVGGYVLYKWRSNDEATPEAEAAHNAYMDQLIRANSDKTNLDSCDEILDRHEMIVDTVQKDVNAHLEQPGSIFYMSTEYDLASLDAHFDRFKDPKHIDMFIRGETRTKVLEMAELWKVAIA